MQRTRHASLPAIVCRKASLLPPIKPNRQNSEFNTPRSKYFPTLNKSTLPTPAPMPNPIDSFWRMIANNQIDEICAFIKQHPEMNMNQRHASGMTPLLLAIADNHDQVVAELLKHPKINPNKPSPNGLTPLHIAIAEGKRKIIALLIRHKKINVNALDEHNTTPLLLALVKMVVKSEQRPIDQTAKIC